MIYTDKLPDGCDDCSCCNVNDGCEYNCNLLIARSPYDSSDVFYGHKYNVRPLNCPLTLIERWRLESCHTCNGKACQAFTSHEFSGATCEDWQPIENDQI